MLQEHCENCHIFFLSCQRCWKRGKWAIFTPTCTATDTTGADPSLGCSLGSPEHKQKPLHSLSNQPSQEILILNHPFYLLKKNLRVPSDSGKVRTIPTMLLSSWTCTSPEKCPQLSSLKQGSSEHRSSLLPCLMHTFKTFLNPFPGGILAVLAVHTLRQAGRQADRVISQKSLNLTRLVQADRQQHCQACNRNWRCQWSHTQNHRSKPRVTGMVWAHSPYPQTSRSLPPLRVLSTSAPSMKKTSSFSYKDCSAILRFDQMQK